MRRAASSLWLALLFRAAINGILAHCKTLTTSESTLHNLTGPLSDRCLPNSIKHFTPVKRKQRDTGGPDMPSHLSVTTHQSPEKSLIHTDPLLICPADTEATAKTSVPVWQHDHSCFHQGWEGTLLLSPLQREIKWNTMTSQAKDTLHLICLILTPVQRKMPRSILIFSCWLCVNSFPDNNWAVKKSPELTPYLLSPVGCNRNFGSLKWFLMRVQHEGWSHGVDDVCYHLLDNNSLQPWW